MEYRLKADDDRIQLSDNRGATRGSSGREAALRRLGHALRLEESPNEVVIANCPQRPHREREIFDPSCRRSNKYNAILIPVFAFLAVGFSPTVAITADVPPVKPAATSTTPAGSGNPPLIIHNPDGTMTVQKEPVPRKSEYGAKKGLVIPPQVVVPMVSSPVNDRRK